MLMDLNWLLMRNYPENGSYPPSYSKQEAGVEEFFIKCKHESNKPAIDRILELLVFAQEIFKK